MSMHTILFADGPQKGEVYSCPTIPAEIVWPMKDPDTGIVTAHRCEVDQTPSADTIVVDDDLAMHRISVHEAHQTSMEVCSWWAPRPMRNGERYEPKLFGPGPTELRQVERERQLPGDEAKLAELMPQLEALLDKYDASILNGDYAEGPMEIVVGLASAEWR